MSHAGPAVTSVLPTVASSLPRASDMSSKGRRVASQTSEGRTAQLKNDKHRDRQLQTQLSTICEMTEASRQTTPGTMSPMCRITTNSEVFKMRIPKFPTMNMLVLSPQVSQTFDIAHRYVRPKIAAYRYPVPRLLNKLILVKSVT